MFESARAISLHECGVADASKRVDMFSVEEDAGTT